MRRPGRIALVVGLGLGGVAWLGWPRPWLVVQPAERPGASPSAVYPGGAGTTFAISWRHSVEKERWVECFRIVDDSIEIAATRFKTFGAGVPDHAGRQTRMVDGWVVMSDIDRRVDPLAVQAAAAEDYRFRYGDGDWQRLSTGTAAPILTFSVRRAPLVTVAFSRLTTVWHGVKQ